MRKFLTLQFPIFALTVSAFLSAAFSAPFAQADAERLQLASVHAAVANLETGELLYSKHDDKIVPIASITKLMTAIVVLESDQPLQEWLEIVEREEAVGKNAYSRMRVGSQLRRQDLLRLALMSSENLAAHVLAHHYPGGRVAFIQAMNDKAQALGMLDSRFVDPSGLGTDNVSTAADLVKLVAAAYQHKRIRDYSTGTYFAAQFRAPRYTLEYGNTNPLVHRKRWDIGLSKTGYIVEAGRCLVMVQPVQSQPVALVFLDAFGTRTPLGDAGRVRRWLETGVGGTVAGAALEYERKMTAAYERTELADKDQ